MDNTASGAADRSSAVTKLTALWALSESGLGGILHALHVPFKGLLIAGIAVVLLTLIARFSNYSFKKIIGATVIVLMVKATVSPHSPLPAYFAVAFQGFMAAAIFSVFKSAAFAPAVIGAVNLIETASQKFIVLTIFFGKNMWQAANALLKEIAEDLSMHPKDNYAVWAVGLYLLFYGIWGALSGIFALKIPQKLENERNTVLNFVDEQMVSEPENSGRPRKKKFKKLLVYVLIFIFIIAVFVLMGGGARKIYAVVLRTLAAVLLMLFVILPLLKFAFSRWLKNRSAGEKDKAQEIMTLMPQLRNHIPVAYQYAKHEKAVTAKFSAFVTALLVLTLYRENMAPAQAITIQN